MDQRLACDQVVEEIPGLGTPDHAVICFHFVDTPVDFATAIREGRKISIGETADFPYCAVVRSMELDLIAYKFQDEDLIKTNLIYDTVGDAHYFHCSVEAHFPEAILYTSEGPTYCLVPRAPEDAPGVEVTGPGSPGRKPLRCRARLARTFFKRSRIIVWNLVLTAEEGAFNEYDLIKLMHLYEGKSEDAELYDKVHFSVASCVPDRGELSASADELLATVWDCLAGEKFRADGRPSRAYNFASPFGQLPAVSASTAPLEIDRRHLPKGATIQLAMGNNIGLDGDSISLERVLGVVYAAHRENALAAAGRPPGDGQDSCSLTLETWLAASQSSGVGSVLKALAGITNGIFDFKEIGDDEIIDTLDPTFSSGDNFIKVHRRTLVNFLDQDRVLDRVSDTLGVSPYVMLPHCVVFHNEELIDQVGDCIEAYANEDRIRRLESLKNVCVRAMHSMYVPNIFNYETERTIYDRAFEIRGSSQKRKISLDHIAELERRIDQAYARHRRRDDAVLQILLLVLAVTQVVVIFVPAEQIHGISPRIILLVGVGLAVLGAIHIVRSLRGK
ncbi:MAG TPA: hypothetical protein VFG50_12230 [Rhodothermales bacterium]|nr:hypothetical protein [Rhodothermales bacterium]